MSSDWQRRNSWSRRLAGRGLSIVSLADIAKTNPETAALLSQPEGSAWELAEDGTFQTVADWQPQD